MGLSPALGNARRRHALRLDAHCASGHLRLAHILFRHARQAAHHSLFRLPRGRLYHGRSRAHRRVRPGLEQCDGLGRDIDHRHAGRLRARQPDKRTFPSARAHHLAKGARLDRRPSYRLRASDPCAARLDRHVPLRAAAVLLLRSDLSAGFSHGFSDADGDGLRLPGSRRSTCSFGPGASTAVSR